jgi:hypothetical protein
MIFPSVDKKSTTPMPDVEAEQGLFTLCTSSEVYPTLFVIWQYLSVSAKPDNFLDEFWSNFFR